MRLQSQQHVCWIPVLERGKPLGKAPVLCQSLSLVIITQTHHLSVIQFHSVEVLCLFTFLFPWFIVPLVVCYIFYLISLFMILSVFGGLCFKFSVCKWHWYWSESRDQDEHMVHVVIAWRTVLLLLFKYSENASNARSKLETYFDGQITFLVTLKLVLLKQRFYCQACLLFSLSVLVRWASWKVNWSC